MAFPSHVGEGRTSLIVNRLFVLFRIYLYVNEKNRCTHSIKQVHLFGLTGAPVQENVVNDKGITTSRKNESGFMCQ